MASIEAKIVLTGGPCAGKTTALARIEEYFSELGYKVLIVGESATELIKGGARPFGDKSLSMIDFQDIILKYQLSKENIYDEIVKALNPNDKCIIVYDRGLMDNSAYVSKEEFNYLLEKNHYSYLELMDRYDLVLHLVTAADGAEAFYTLENNAARSETREEAIALDQKTMNAWSGHRNLEIIDNSVTFEEKLDKVIESIHNLLGNPISIRHQKKYLIDGQTISQKLLDNSIGVEIEQTYLGSDEYEKRLRKRTLGNEITYYYTVQKHDLHGTSKVLIDRKITSKEYDKLMFEYPLHRTVKKTRYTFIRDKKYYRLDIFDDGVVILETSDAKAKIPSDLKVIGDITEDSEFYNINLAHQKATKKIYS